MKATSNELVITRIFEAPRELVWKAWTEPKQFMRWWGPQGFTNTFHEFDLRPGGYWRFIMHGPDGSSYENESVFVEVSRPERIVFRHISAPHFLMTITLDNQAGKTKITWHMLFESVTERNNIAKYALDANEQNLDRLEAHLAAMTVQHE
ncbi:MAG: SRPBCC family protein [Candidatus Zixiibacteriota bacterium]